MLYLSVVGWFTHPRLAQTGTQELAVWICESSPDYTDFQWGVQDKKVQGAAKRVRREDEMTMKSPFWTTKRLIIRVR